MTGLTNEQLGFIGECTLRSVELAVAVAIPLLLANRHRVYMSVLNSVTAMSTGFHMLI